MPIDPASLQSLQRLQETQPGSEGMGRSRELQSGDDSTFSDMVKNAINSVDEAKKTADQNVENFVAGEEEDIHKVMISLQKANTSFELMLQMRNKVIDTYREISRMRV